jgi:tetratricopeptide (TPR) repeat protein
VRRRWLVLLAVAMVFLTQVTSLRAAWLRNLAVLELPAPWLAQRAEFFDPPCHDANGTFSGTKRYLELALAQEPANTRTLTQLGRVRWLEGDCENAVAAWKQATLGHNPAAAFELFRIGAYDALSSDLRLVLADYAYQRAVDSTRNPEDPTTIQWFRRAFELVPQHRSAEALARWYEKTGNASDVVGLWQKMTDRLPNTNAEYWWAEGRKQALNNNWESAAQAYEKGSSLASDPYEYWIEAGSAWEKIEKWEQAIAVYDRARQSQPTLVASYLGLGNVHRLQKQYPEALKWYAHTQQVYPEYAHPYYYLGLTYYLMGDYTQAERELRTALGLNPDHISAMYFLAQILHDAGNLPLAESWLVDAINHLPVSPPSWWEQLGDWRLEQRHCPEADAAYLRAQASGSAEQTIQQKLKTLSEVCGSQ